MSFQLAETHDLWNHERFRTLVDHATGAIGRVVSSEQEPSGSHVFAFWADDSAITLDIGHIVVTFSEEAAVIGVVDEPRRFSDLHSFLDDYFDRRIELAMIEEGQTRRPEILVFRVNVLATMHLRDDVTSNRPAVNGPVFFATEEAIRYALGVRNFSGAKVPALMHTNGNYARDDQGTVQTDVLGRPRFQTTPLFLDEEYLLGPEAGHANWTGQSGLATKTSHALFLTSSIFQTLEKEGKSVAALMFNVKGPDLLWLDKPAQPEADMEDAYRAAGGRGLDDDQLRAYADLGLAPRPFENVRIFAPFRPGSTPKDAGGVVDLSGFSRKADLNTERSVPGQDANVFPILWSLETALHYPHKLFSFNDLDDKLFGFIFELRERRVESFAQLKTLFEEIEQHFANGNESWFGHHPATIRKAQNRFKGLSEKFGGLLSEGQVSYPAGWKVDDRFSPNELRVVDISACNTNVKELIATSTITNIWRLAEKSDMGVDKLIIFVDELNKYGAAGSVGGVRDTLVDIAARGRHLNVVLMGAQQFRSKVDDEILGNCGTSFYGRIGDEEIINAAYRSISDTQKKELLGLPKGRLLVRHAHYRSPLFGTFPYPPSVPGMVGQRIYGSTTSGSFDAIDPLFRMLREIMGDKAPSKAEIRNEADGLTPEEIDAVRSRCAAIFGNSISPRTRHWESVKTQLSIARQRKNVR